MQTVEVARNCATSQPVGQTQQLWRFYFYERDATLYVDYYHFAQRASYRHKFKPQILYSRLDTRNNDIEVADVPLPQDVIDEAIVNFTAQLSVKKWEKP